MSKRKPSSQAWGLTGAPILPAVLRDRLGEVVLPEWVAESLRLKGPATAGQLGPDVALPEGRFLERVLAFLADLVSSKLHELADVRAIDNPWPADLDPSAVPWRTRTKNRLAWAGLLEDPHRLSQVTFGELARIPQMGPVGILDFLATLEAAVRQLAPPTSHNQFDDSSDGASKSSRLIVGALEADWADNVSAADRRFAGLMPPARGTLYELIDALTSGADSRSNPQELLDAIAGALPGISERAEQIRQKRLEDAASDLMASLLGRDDAVVRSLILRMQWSGEASAWTLEQAGALAGISRERVRQLEQKVRGILASNRFFLPQVDKAMELLAGNSPCTTEDAAHLLLVAGITKTDFHPKSLLAMARDLQRTALIQVARVKGHEAVEHGNVNPLADKAIGIAYRQLAQVGSSNVAAVAAELPQESLISEQELEQILTTYGHVQFIADGWFWCPERPCSNILTQVKKMLSVVSRMDIGSLREGLKRAMRFRRISILKSPTLIMPPRAALLAYLQAQGEFLVDADGMVEHIRPLDYRQELSLSEQILVQVLSGSPAGALDRARFESSCASRGLRSSTFSILTSYSAILDSPAFGLWSLRGRRLDPSAIETLRKLSAERPRERSVQDYGWLPNGRLWLAIRLPGDPTKHLLAYIPSAISRYLVQRDFIASTEGGSACGRIRVYERGVSSGYSTFLKRAGADEGDILLAEFDLSQQSVKLRLTDEDQLEELVGAA